MDEIRCNAMMWSGSGGTVPGRPSCSPAKLPCDPPCRAWQYHKCIKEHGEDSGNCKPYMRAYRWWRGCCPGVGDWGQSR